MDVASLRNSLSLTQEQLAAALGISPGHVGDLERGRRHLSIPVAAKLEKLTGKPGLVDAVAAEISAGRKAPELP